MTKFKKKKQILVKIGEPYFIHKEAKGTDMTFMIGKYAIPWNGITNVPLCDAVITKIEKVRKCFPEAHIEFNFNRENPAFIFNVVGRTKRCINDKADKGIGETVAKAKATAKACVVAKAIIKAAMDGLEEELKRSFIVFDEWHDKEKRIVRGV